jgi:hypothetical protein
MSDSPAYRHPLTRRIVEITDEDETILIAFVPVGVQKAVRSCFYATTRPL